MAQSIALNSSYTSQVIPPTREGEQSQQIGNKTECAMLGFLVELKQDYKKIREQTPEQSYFKVVSLFFRVSDHNNYDNIFCIVFQQRVEALVVSFSTFP